MLELCAMRVKRSRIIVDTNLWISYLISKGFKHLDDLILREKAIFLFSDELLEEFVEVAKREKFKKYFSYDDVLKLLELFDSYGEIIKVTHQVNGCRDVKDNFLLSLAVNGKADYLITGDSDLLVLESFENTKILTITQFEALR